MHEMARPVGGKIVTRSTRWLLVLAGVGALLLVWRFLAGLGATTGLNDGYPWGIWIAWDVVVGTALACGGYAVALLCYVLNRGHYHPLVRSAILTSALGYSMAGISIVVDVGRYWNLWKVVLFPGKWNLNSVLLEVALCVMAYVVVLWIELSPTFLERWRDGAPGFRQRLAAALLPRLERILIWIIALGLLLPTMHQSSLGSVMLIARGKLDPVWLTPWLPLLFLVSCITMGYAVVILEALLSGALLRRPLETRLLGDLAWSAAVVTALFLLLRLGDLAVRGQLLRAFHNGWLTLFWVLELGAFGGGLAMLLQRRRRRRPGHLLRMAMLILVGGILYRLDTYLVAFSPGPGWHYFPTIPEQLITCGFIAVEVLLYIAMVRRFPILAGVRPVSARAAGSGDPPEGGD